VGLRGPMIGEGGGARQEEGFRSSWMRGHRRQTPLLRIRTGFPRHQGSAGRSAFREIFGSREPRPMIPPLCPTRPPQRGWRGDSGTGGTAGEAAARGAAWGWGRWTVGAQGMAGWGEGATTGRDGDPGEPGRGELGGRGGGSPGCGGGPGDPAPGRTSAPEPVRLRGAGSIDRSGSGDHRPRRMINSWISMNSWAFWRYCW